MKYLFYDAESIDMNAKFLLALQSFYIKYIESICNKANYIWSNNITIQKNSNQ